MPIDTASTAKNVKTMQGHQPAVEQAVRDSISKLEGMPAEYHLLSGVTHDNRDRSRSADPELVFKIMIDKEIFERRDELPQIYNGARIRYFLYEEVQALAARLD